MGNPSRHAVPPFGLPLDSDDDTPPGTVLIEGGVRAGGDFETLPSLFPYPRKEGYDEHRYVDGTVHGVPGVEGISPDGAFLDEPVVGMATGPGEHGCGYAGCGFRARSAHGLARHARALHGYGGLPKALGYAGASGFGKPQKSR